MATEQRPVALPNRQGAVATPTAPKPKLPNGLRWSNVWRGPDGKMGEPADRELPVDADWNIAGRLFLCPTVDCPVEEWVFTPADQVEQPKPCCTRHPQQLVEVRADSADKDPVGSARAKIRAVLAARRQKVVGAAWAQAETLRAAAEDAAKRRAADLHGHVPSLSASAAVMLAGEIAAHTTHPLLSLSVGLVLATAGTVVAYIAAYWAEKIRAAEALVGRAGKKARARARHIAGGVLAAGVWLLATVPTVALAPVWGTAATVLAGCLAAWVVNRSHWDELWATRRRLAELARLRAEAAARKAEEVQQPEPAPVEVDETPEQVGRRMAAQWAQIARSNTVPAGFLMAHTWIVPEETREVTAPIDGRVVRIGYEFAIESDPGALVSRIGAAPPLVSCREWLAAMLNRDSSTVSLVDRPEGRANRGLLLLTDRAPLGGAVKWKGAAGVRTAADGTIYVHAGRTITGEDVEEAAYTPGQPFGGLVVGHTGGGKGGGAILALLNDLAAGIFPVLYDPKQLVDYADFIGVFPIGVTREHRDVILRSLHAERARRERHLAARPLTDRHGRRRTQQSLWNPAVDGPPIHHMWDEFHMEATDKPFVASLTELYRLQRVSAIGGDIITQGGGLSDLADSVLRGLLNQTRMRLYRMPDNLARLAGYTGAYMPSELPRLPGMCLTVSAEAPPIPLRTAFVTREDVDGCVFDQLYAPDMTPILTAPTLPAATLEVFEREGLMDLWRLGQGPDGMTKLLSDSSALAPTTAAVVAAGGALQAADVLLAVVLTNPGCGSTIIGDHAAWLSQPGGGKPAVPSTVSRAAKALEKDGLITRCKQGAEYVDYRVTDKGQARAAAALAVLFPAAGQTAELSAAQIEQQAEADAEMAEAR